MSEAFYDQPQPPEAGVVPGLPAIPEGLTWDDILISPPDASLAEVRKYFPKMPLELGVGSLLMAVESQAGPYVEPVDEPPQQREPRRLWRRASAPAPTPLQEVDNRYLQLYDPYLADLTVVKLTGRANETPSLITVHDMSLPSDRQRIFGMRQTIVVDTAARAVVRATTEHSRGTVVPSEAPIAGENLQAWGNVISRSVLIPPETMKFAQNPYPRPPTRDEIRARAIADLGYNPLDPR
jgi:hypothetical protein